MTKTFIRTRDIFDIDNGSIRQRYFKYCYEAALKCGLQCVQRTNKDGFIVLELSGPKCQFVKYYFKTLSKTTSKMDGVKRLISIIFT